MQGTSLFTTPTGILTTTKKTGLENTVGKGENAGNQYFLLLPQCFLLSTKPKEFADKFKFGEHGRKFSKPVENTVEKEKVLVWSNFPFSISVFKRLVLQGLFGKGVKQTIKQYKSLEDSEERAAISSFASNVLKNHPQDKTESCVN